jgi:hypothetical protein
MHLVAVLVAAVAAFILTCASCAYQRRGPELVVVGNVCGPSGNDLCYEPVLKGGFPLAYIYDAPGVSVQGKLDLGEDKLRPGAFALDVFAYFVALLVARAAIGSARSGAQ